MSGKNQLQMARQVEVALIMPFLPAPSPTPAAGSVGEQHLLHRFIKQEISGGNRSWANVGHEQQSVLSHILETQAAFISHALNLVFS